MLGYHTQNQIAVSSFCSKLFKTFLWGKPLKTKNEWARVFHWQRHCHWFLSACSPTCFLYACLFSPCILLAPCHDGRGPWLLLTCWQAPGRTETTVSLAAGDKHPCCYPSDMLVPAPFWTFQAEDATSISCALFLVITEHQMMCARACGPGDAQHNEQSISQMQVDFYCGNTLLHNPCLLFVQSACYENCSRSNVSYFMMVAHSDRGRCWWNGSRGWTFPPISCYILLLCDRWQQRDSPTKWCLTWKRTWSKGGALSSSMQKNGTQWCSLMLAECLWRLHSEAVCCSSGDSDMKFKPHYKWPYTSVTPWNEEHLN